MMRDRKYRITNLYRIKHKYSTVRQYSSTQLFVFVVKVEPISGVGSLGKS